MNRKLIVFFLLAVILTPSIFADRFRFIFQKGEFNLSEIASPLHDISDSEIPSPIIAYTYKFLSKNKLPILNSDYNHPLLVKLHFPNPIVISDRFDKRMSEFATWLQKHPRIRYLMLSNLDMNGKRYAYVIKKIWATAKSVRPRIRIAMDVSRFVTSRKNRNRLRKRLLTQEMMPYYDAFYLDGFRHPKRLLNRFLRKKADLEIWRNIDSIASEFGHPLPLIDELIKNRVFSRVQNPLYLVSKFKPEYIQPLQRFAELSEANLYPDGLKRKILVGRKKTIEVMNFIRPSDRSELFFFPLMEISTVRIPVDAKRDKKLKLYNLATGRRVYFPLEGSGKWKQLSLGVGYYVATLVPNRSNLKELNYRLNVGGFYTPSGDEIIARTRVWKERVRQKIRHMTGVMHTSLRLRIANINESFDLSIQGPFFSDNGRNYDWVWQSFFINGVQWKSKKAPKIPLLQPEKVQLLPADLTLDESYRYRFVNRDVFKGTPVFVVDFEPKDAFKSSVSYKGTLWIDRVSYQILKERLVQINLKGEVLSHIETRYYEPVNNDKIVRYPQKIKGHQVISIAGRITNVEKEVQLQGLTLQDPDFFQKKTAAHRSPYQMVRETDVGLRYLVKEKKSNSRKVEWKTKKSQLLLVLGGFSDSSMKTSLPIIGANYLNFDLGGSGKQLNVLFGGAMLTANFSEPSLFGSKIDLGANLIAIAFPFRNAIYRNNRKVHEEKVKRWPFKFQINAGFPIGPYLKLTNMFFLNYDHYGRTDDTSDTFIIPQSTGVFGIRTRLSANIDGYNLSLWGESAKRGKWAFWGLPENAEYSDKQRHYYRWRFILKKDFHLSGFKKFHLSLCYYGGKHMDRFSAYKIGFFNELRMKGFMSGIIQATEALTLKLSYGYSIGKAFRLEASYDSALISNSFNDLNRKYFSSAAISGTVNIPGLNVICRFEAGLPVIAHGLRGSVIYVVLMKML